MHLRKLINTFYKEHLEKSTVTLPFLDSALLMTRSLVSKKTKQKRDCLNKRANKRSKNQHVGLKLLMSCIFMDSDLNVTLKLLIQHFKDFLF